MRYRLFDQGHRRCHKRDELFAGVHSGFDDGERLAGLDDFGAAADRVADSGPEQVDLELDGENLAAGGTHGAGGHAARVIGERRDDARVREIVLLHVFGAERHRRFAPTGAEVDEVDAEMLDESRAFELMSDELAEFGVRGDERVFHFYLMGLAADEIASSQTPLLAMTVR